VGRTGFSDRWGDPHRAHWARAAPIGGIALTPLTPPAGRGTVDGYWPGPPDLAIEVVSPNDGRSAVDGKTLDWLASGTRAVVVLDPPLRTATVYRARDDIRVLTADETLDLGDVVPGWSARVGDLFA
jgi:Uma2 family endonuclease